MPTIVYTDDNIEWIIVSHGLQSKSYIMCDAYIIYLFNYMHINYKYTTDQPNAGGGSNAGDNACFELFKTTNHVKTVKL